MTHGELSDWLDYYDESGYQVETIRFMLGQVAAVVAMGNTGKRFTAEEFYPVGQAPKKKLKTWQQMKAVTNALADRGGSK
jgi:hypothetical protein